MKEEKVEQPKQESQEERNIRGIESEIWRVEQIIIGQQQRREDFLNKRAQMIAKLSSNATSDPEQSSTTTG